MDKISKNHRSWNMARIKSSDTSPEKITRSLLHRMGYRFRIQRDDLPGKPDIVLPKYNTAILVHGCFWHRHANCKYSYTPKSNVSFWEKKFEQNITRDERNIKNLESTGWNVLVVWECETKNQVKLIDKLIHFLK